MARNQSSSRGKKKLEKMLPMQSRIFMRHLIIQLLQSQIDKVMRSAGPLVEGQDLKAAGKALPLQLK